MKNLLIIVLFGFTSINYAFAISGQSPRLKCQIEDMGTRRIVDQKIAEFPTNNKPILLILGVDQLMGTIRDFQGPTINDRSLNLTFSFGFPGGPNSNGMGTSHASYHLDQEITTEALAEVEMMDPNFPTTYSLQCFLIK